mmetsp:Transcript_3263/g.8321  ORF Transcript_3263/g.8321 Transcript_3263/m.8321 type:complete len:432 (-) Transcript_3263:46-1341(-)
MIENAGYQHLYGIAPVLNALKANVRNFASPEEGEKDDLMDFRSRLSETGLDDNNEFASALEDEIGGNESSSTAGGNSRKKKDVKPEAKLQPHLFVQEGTLDNGRRSFRSNAKQEASAEILALAGELEMDVAEVDKGVLNTLCNNRPHQGFVLRCGGLDFSPLRRLPGAGDGGGSAGPKLWLALDEVVDPQNLGALLRSAYFLGRGAGIVSDGSDDAITSGEVGILVCSKNSSPLTPAVSAASAGALEFTTVYSTSNLPRLLNGAKEEGWRILGAAAEVPDGATSDYAGGGNNGVRSAANDKASDEGGWDLGEGNDGEDDPGIIAEADGDGDDDDDVGKDDAPRQERKQQQCLDLRQVETGSPTILVLGSEGRGLRTLVARACTGFVSVPGGGASVISDDDEEESKTQAGVDSLNVSVTGGILLWHFLSKGS